MRILKTARNVRPFAQTGQRGPDEATGLAMSQTHEDFVVLNFDLKRSLTQSRVEAVLAVGHVELPAMPRASDYGSVQLSLCKRSALMSTDTVHRVKLPIDVEQRNKTTAHHNFFTAAHCNFSRGRNLLPICHVRGNPDAQRHSCEPASNSDELGLFMDYALRTRCAAK